MIQCTGFHFNKELLKISRLCFMRYMEGNFKLAPQGYPFQQVYIKRGNIGETASTLVYCLMESLEQAAYIIEVLNKLRQECDIRGVVLHLTRPMCTMLQG